MNIKENISLREYTTLKVGGKALFFISIKNEGDFKEAFEFIKKNKLPFIILGGGSNILVNDKGFPGVALKIEIKGVSTKPFKNFEELEVGAGESWDKFVKYTAKKNLWGLENLSGIPGTVGASVIQNIGAYGSEVKDTVSKVYVFDYKKNKFFFLKNKECGFGYRDSLFKKTKNNHLVVVKVFFNLSPTSRPNLRYKDLKFLEKESPDISKIRNTVIKIRKGKFPDLRKVGTAGSFFKNIIVGKKSFRKMQDKYKDIVFFETSDGKIKISSAWILDKVLNIKGLREGDVGLYHNQPLVLVNFGNATTNEIKKFAEKIKFQVFKKTGLILEEEVVII